MVSPHFHVLFLDSGYGFSPGREPIFHPTPAPRADDIAHVVAAGRLIRDRRAWSRRGGRRRRRRALCRQRGERGWGGRWALVLASTRSRHRGTRRESGG